MNEDGIDRRTIADFGAQWTRYAAIDAGHDSSPEALADILGPHFDASRFAGARVIEIGSGSGRIVKMLLDAGAREVLAIEPSEAAEVLRRNAESWGDRVKIFRTRGDRLPADIRADYALSIGVLHHIKDPRPTMVAAWNSLSPGGFMVAWLYGHEGNEAYLNIVEPLRRLTTILPVTMLAGLSHAIALAAHPYMWLCRFLPGAPLASYMTNVFRPSSYRTRQVVVFDQLKPAYAKYYRRSETIALFESVGFVDIAIHHRHGYSWTVCGRKPADAIVHPPGSKNGAIEGSTSPSTFP